MVYNYALHLLVLELEKAMKEKALAEELCAEGKDFYRQLKVFCRRTEDIEQLQEAIKILKANL